MIDLLWQRYKEMAIVTNFLPIKLRQRHKITIYRDATPAHHHDFLPIEDDNRRHRHTRRKGGRGIRRRRYAPLATLNRRSPARLSASRKGNGVAISRRRYRSR